MKLLDRLFHKKEKTFDFAKYHEEKYQKLDPEVKRRGIEILKANLPEEEQSDIREYIKGFGKSEWMIKINQHFYRGMAIRNILRQGGLKDDLLPTGNWDDYYVTLIEEAVE